MPDLSVLGKPVPRVDAKEKVTGEALYTADIKLPKMLYGKILRSPHPHARIVRIDATAALRLPGVKAVVTSKDFPPDARYGEFVKDQQPFPTDKVRYRGEPVGAVAAVDEETADRALDLITVEYEELPAVFDPEEAMKPEAPIIHERLESYPTIWPMIKHGNICNHAKINRGDVEKGFKDADVVFEERFTTPIVHNGYIEPHAAVAQVDRSGNITVWSSTQGAFATRAMLSEIFRVPESKIRVIAPKIGGGFGGKLSDVLIEPSCIALSQKSGRPVRIVMSREEEFMASNPRHASIIDIKTGCMKDGTLIARQATLMYDTGGVSSAGPLTVCIGAPKALGPYRIPNVKVDSYCVYTNNTKCAAMRGFGAPQATFAVESHMDSIAELLKIDPLELRMKNALESGDLACTGQVMENVGLKETLRVAAERGNWGKELEGKNRGRGIACFQFQATGLPSCAYVKINEDGTIGLLAGALDIGQGSDTMLCQIVAEELGVPLEDVSLVTADTDTTPFDFGSIGDRVTFTAGNAARRAAQDAKRQVLERAAQMLHEDVNNLELKDRMVFVKGLPEKMIPLIGISMEAHYINLGGPIMGTGMFFPEDDPYEAETVEGAAHVALHDPNYTTQVAEVEVDKRTGNIAVLKLTAAQDVGFAINPLSVKGQMQGGIVQGIGYALTEGYSIDKGEVLNRSFKDYKMPGAMDIPGIETAILEGEKGKAGPYGAKAVGNPPIVPTAPAIANAIYDAIGIRIKDLPITPDKIIKALKQKGSEKQ